MGQHNRIQQKQADRLKARAKLSPETSSASAAAAKHARRAKLKTETVQAHINAVASSVVIDFSSHKGIDTLKKFQQSADEDSD